MIGEKTFQGLQSIGITTTALEKLDADFDSLQAKIAAAEAEISGLRPSDNDYDSKVEKLEAKIRTYKAQLTGVAADISSGIDGIKNQVKLNPASLVEQDTEEVEALDREVLSALFAARDILKRRGKAAEKLQGKIDVINALGGDLSDTQMPWGGPWAGWELAWPEYVNRHALLFSGGRGAEGAWSLFADKEA